MLSGGCTHALDLTCRSHETLDVASLQNWRRGTPGVRRTRLATIHQARGRDDGVQRIPYPRMGASHLIFDIPHLGF